MTPALLLLAACGQLAQDSAGPAAPPAQGAAQAAVVSAADTAALVVHGTTVFVFRAPVGAASASERAEAAARRLDAVLSRATVDSLRIEPVAEGMLVRAGDAALFLVTRGDGDPTVGGTPTHLAARSVVLLREAMALEVKDRSFGTLLRAAAEALLATLLFVLALRLIHGAASAALSRAPEVTRQLPGLRIGGFTLVRARQVTLFVRRTVLVGGWVLAAILAYLWITFVLTRFPLTRPWGQALGGFLVATVRDLALGAVGAIPGLITVLIIFAVTRGLTRLVTGFFASIESGRVVVPWVHADTAQPTRRIALALLWIFAIVVAYPYLPGSGSDVFKGVSVFLGVVLSLGSTGLVNQAMSGLVLMYARSFRPGEYVRIGEVEGTVTSLALLSTKIRTTKDEEVTIPSAVIVAGGTTNYSRLADERGAILYTTVTIGYDTPWRQVHALLALAASRTGGLRRDPPPFVLQTALSDFYVEYQLNVRLERPEARIAVLSELHTAILDAFNEYGVQIMSPHFMTQPAEPVRVSRERWSMPPADGGLTMSPDGHAGRGATPG